MTLLELCEPLFQFVCKLNRMGRKGTAPDYAGTKNDVKGLFTAMAEKARTDQRLFQQYVKVEMPLVFFVDSMLADSGLKFAPEWNRQRLAYERNELAGDEKFFDLLDETMADNREGSDERLAIFYTCLGLGFAGWYAGQPEYLRKKMNEMLPRIRSFVDTDENGYLCPEAYQYTNTVNLPLPVGSSLIPFLIAVAGLVVLVFVANFYLFRTASEDLNTSLDEILKRDPAAANPAP